MIIGEAFCTFIFFHFPDSGLSVLNSLLSFFVDGVTVEIEAKNQAPYTEAVCHLS